MTGMRILASPFQKLVQVGTLLQTIFSSKHFKLPNIAVIVISIKSLNALLDGNLSIVAGLIFTIDMPLLKLID